MVSSEIADACRACGACCAYSAEWPRFSLETDTQLDRIPHAFVDDERGRMRCEGNRCAALVGKVGVETACAVYSARPQVCRACLPGDAGRRWGVGMARLHLMRQIAHSVLIERFPALPASCLLARWQTVACSDSVRRYRAACRGRWRFSVRPRIPARLRQTSRRR